MLRLRNKNAVTRKLMTRMMIRQEMKEKTKFKHVKSLLHGCTEGLLS